MARAVDHGIPAAFQVLEWMVVIAAIRWAGERFDIEGLRQLAVGTQMLLAVYVARQIMRLSGGGRIFLESYGQPLRLLAINVLIIAGAAFMLSAAMGFVDQMVTQLTELNGEAPPSYPPETPEQSVNVNGGQGR